MNLFDKVKPVFNIDDEMNELLVMSSTYINERKIVKGLSVYAQGNYGGYKTNDRNFTMVLRFAHETIRKL